MIDGRDAALAHVILPDIIIHFGAGVNARVFCVRESRQVDSVLLRVDQPPLHAALAIEDGNLYGDAERAGFIRNLF